MAGRCPTMASMTKAERTGIGSGWRPCSRKRWPRAIPGEVDAGSPSGIAGTETYREHRFKETVIRSESHRLQQPSRLKNYV